MKENVVVNFIICVLVVALLGVMPLYEHWKSRQRQQQREMQMRGEYYVPAVPVLDNSNWEGGRRDLPADWR